MRIRAVSTYLPTWEHRGRRVTADDEDVLTLAVAAARPLVEGHDVSRVVLVVSAPDVVVGFGFGVVSRALGLTDDVGVELRVGGAAAMLDALLQASTGTLVVGVDASAGAAASGAVLVGDAGATVVAAGRISGSLPMRVRLVGAPEETVYGDPRVERELSISPLVKALRGDGEIVVLGVPAAEAKRSKARPVALPTADAASLPFAVATLRAEGASSVRVLAVDGGSAVAADVDLDPAQPVDVHAEERPALPSGSRPDLRGDTAPIPFSMPAYARAFDAKVGLEAATCQCGEVSYPPRTVCLGCGSEGTTTPTPLPRTGTVYTSVKIHVPIPGVPGPYTLAIIALDGSPVRVLAQVADLGDRELAIGERGRLLLRRVALREGFPDYGYAFQADPATSNEGVSS